MQPRYLTANLMALVGWGRRALALAVFVAAAGAVVAVLGAQAPPADLPVIPSEPLAVTAPVVPSGAPATAEGETAAAGVSTMSRARTRLASDLEAVRSFRPAYPFWQYIYTIPDGRIIFGSAEDGRLLATFPSTGNWIRDAKWEDESLATLLEGRSLPRRLRDRRQQVEELLTERVGGVVHNPTRGLFLLPNAERYGSLLEEWGRIYERFGVPAEIGLAQAVIESGLNGRIRSRARALGFCQWLPRNWNRLKRLSPHVIEGYNQTTQASYCAAYLTVLATMYGSFIPALSEHHAGGVNVGRAMINGERLGGDDSREQYFMGSQFARELRSISIQRYRELFRTYGPRSFRYAEMIFGNTLNVRRIQEETPQEQVFAMRVRRNLSLTQIMRTTGLSEDEVKRFNPALVRQVPARATVYLPFYVEEFGPDVSFWHRPPSPEFAEVMDEFLGLDATVQEWHEPTFVNVLRAFRDRFEAIGTEESVVMAATLGFVIADFGASRRPRILEEFRTSRRIRQLFERGLRELASNGSTCCSAR